MRLVLTLLFLSTLTTLIACKKDTVKAPFTPKPDELSRELYPRVVCEKPLADWLVSGTPIVRRDTGPLDVTVPLRLTSSNPSQFARTQYRFIFLDASGVPIRSQSEWRYFQLEPRNEFFLRGTALDTTATDWRCEIRSNR
ncbi:MAG: DUF1425 domain-containing protein [Phycisphaerae bacterium]|nr:DUF1425 domain-containing protein [Phycisphaerae bacterium]